LVGTERTNRDAPPFPKEAKGGIDPSNIRAGAPIHTEPDTDAPSYSWTTSDGPMTPGACWFYKVYGYKVPCGESNQGEN